MGFGPTAQVPVNLSNGEFRLSPEQVHAIGVQVLEGMKAATHTPAGGQGGSDGDDASTRELFFADGGLVEDPNKKRPLATSPTNTYPGNQAERAGNIYAQSNADMSTRIGDASRAVPGASLLADGSQTRMVAGQIGNAWNENADKGNYAKAAGATLRGTAAMIPRGDGRQHEHDGAANAAGGRVWERAFWDRGRQADPGAGDDSRARSPSPDNARRHGSKS
jgi:hypothetical protein